MSKVLAQTVEALQRLLDRRDATIAQQAAHIAALESELATLQASVVAAMSSAGPEVAEDERTA